MKPEFLTPLRVEQITETDWRVTADFLYASAALDREVVVPAGFVTDFASVPRLPVVYLAAGGVAVRPAVLHDYLYRSGTAPKAQADAVFLEAMELVGVSWWRRRLMWAGVAVFGGSSYRAINPVNSGEGNVAAHELRVSPPTPSPEAIASAAEPPLDHLSGG